MRTLSPPSLADETLHSGAAARRRRDGWSWLRARRPLISVVVLCLVILVGLWLAVFRALDHEREAALAEARRELDTLAAAFEAHVARTLRQTDQLALELKRSYPSGNLGRFSDVHAALDGSALLQFSVIDEGGQLAWSSLPGFKRIDLSDREHFRAHVAADRGEPFVSKPVLGRVSGKWSIQVSRRINKPDGAFAGVAVVSVDPALLASPYSDLVLGERAALLLMGRDGAPRARRGATPGRDTLDGLLGADLLAALASHGRGHFESVGADGILRLWSLRPVEKFPSLMVLAGTARDDAVATYSKQHGSYVGAAGALSMVAVWLCAALGVTIRREQRTAATLRAREERYRRAVSGSQAGLWDWDRVKSRYYASPRLKEMLGYREDEAPTARAALAAHVHPADRDRALAAVERHFRDRAPFDLEFRVARRDGSVIWVHAAGEAMRDEAGEIVRFSGSAQDVTARKAAETRAEQLVAEQRAILEASFVGLAFVRDRYLVRCNRQFATMFGYEPDEIAGLSIERLHVSAEQFDARAGMYELLRRGERFAEDMQLRRKDGSLFWAHARVTAIDPQDLTKGVVWVAQDITERKLAETRLKQLAHFDSLTGLPNRALFRDRLATALAQIGRRRTPIGLLFVDLDRFKKVNDTLGHDAGDALLRVAARRLAAVVRQTDTVARLGGDEFAVVLPDLHGAHAAGQVAEKIVRAFRVPFGVDGHELHVTPSIGIAVAPGDGEDADVLIRNADVAMYQAKEQGRNGFQFYAREMNARAGRLLKLEAELRHALERGEFLLHYQPRIEIASGRVVGVEALLRWQKDGTLVPPAEFVPTLEDTGLIIPVGEWVLAEACRQAAAWHLQGAGQLRVGVNVSARQLTRGDFGDAVERVLAAAGIAPDALVLELTETAVMHDPERAAAAFDRLKQRGVHLAIDDFGTGYSSLGYLKRFAPDSLKIDRSFVRDLPNDANDVALVTAIIAMAHSLGIAVTAEGVETAPQLDLLTRLGCDEYQGYLASRPVPAERILEFARARVTAARAA